MSVRRTQQAQGETPTTGTPQKLTSCLQGYTNQVYFEAVGTVAGYMWLWFVE